MSATGSTAELDGLMARLTPAALQVPCTAAGHAIQARYEQDAPRDTGSMALSVYVHPALGESDYGARTAAADSVNPRVGILSELPAPEAPGVVVGVAASHGVMLEYGVSGRAARPTFTPAVEEERAQFPERVKRAVWGNG